MLHAQNYKSSFHYRTVGDPDSILWNGYDFITSHLISKVLYKDVPEVD